MIEDVLGPGQPPRMHWRKSSYSGTAGNCIQVAELDQGARAVRDSKDPAGPTLTFTADEWSAFTSKMCVGDFDRRCRRMSHRYE
ncbi:MAG: DUF397 domain-containing protein [Pseudonocardiaceae bacterium]